MSSGVLYLKSNLDKDSGINRPCIAAMMIAIIPVAMVVIPWDFGPTITIYRALMRGLSLPVMIVEALVAIVAVQKIVHSGQNLRNINRRYKLGLMAIALIALYTSIFIAVEPYLTFISLYMWIIHLLFGYGVFLLFVDARPTDRQLVWKTMSLGILAYIVILAFVVLYNMDNPDFNWIGLLPGMPNVRQLGYLSVMGFAASTAFVHKSGPGPGYWFGLVIASISFALAIWSGTRGALIAIFAALCIAAWYKKELRTRQFAAWLIVSLIAGLAIASLLAVPNESFGIGRIIGSISDNYDSAERLSSGRGEMWAGTINMILERPLFGYGERQFQFVVPEALGGYKQPHNALLQYLLSWGIIGAGIFFFLICRLVGDLYQKSNRFATVGLPEILIIVALLSYSLYDGALYAPYSLAMLIFAFASAFASVNQPAPAADRSD